MNNLDKIYQELGEGICLYPFIGAFYSCVDSVPNDVDKISNFIRPCSLVRWDGENNPWYLDGKSLKEARNGDRWKLMRKKFLDGSWKDLPDCTTCIYTEKLGSVSPRMNNNQFLAELLDEDIVQMVQTIKDNDYETNVLKMLDYYPSNYCNFECTMCGGGASSKRHVFERQHLNRQEKVLVNPVDPDFFDMLPDLEVLGFTGGETVMQPEVHQVINKLISEGLADKVNITVLTNASTYPVSLVDKFAKFKKVMYTVSLDGTHDIIEYQRRGAEWPTIEKNVRLIHENPNIHEIINFVVTSMNILNAIDMIDWCHDNDMRFFTISPVVRKEYLGPSSMPYEIRQIALDRLYQGKQKYSHYDPDSEEGNYVKAIDQIIGNIENNPFDPAHLQQFIEHINIENQASKKKLHEVVPEWAPYFISVTDIT